MDIQNDGLDSGDESNTKSIKKDLRNEKVPTDFMIKVGEESFHVHHQTITEKSEYFRAMLEHDTEEKQQGFVNMIDVNAIIVQQCIEFMYSGDVEEVSIDLQIVEDVLQASEIMQLDEITQACVRFLERELKAENCIKVSKLATKFNISSVQDSSEKIFRETYKLDNTSDLLQLSQQDLVTYVNEHHPTLNEIAWECIKHWAEFDFNNRKEYTHKILDTMSWYPLQNPNFLEKLQNETMFQESQECKDLFNEKLFTDIDKFKKYLNAENYFILRKFATQFRFTPKQITDKLNKFIFMYPASISMQKEYKDLPIESIRSILTSKDHEYLFNEKWKWIAICCWVKHDVELRKSSLPELLQTIKFDKLPKNFIKDVIAEEPLVQQNFECSKILLNLFLRKKENDRKYIIALLYSNKEVRMLDLSTNNWSTLPNLVKSIAQICSLNGKLTVLCGNEHFFLSKTREWIQIASTTHIVDDSAKVATTDDYIYVVSEDWTLQYDAATNRWDESLPGVKNDWNHGDILAVSVKNSIWLLNRQNFLTDLHPAMLDVNTKSWVEVNNVRISQRYKDSAIYVGGNIFIFTRSAYVGRCSKEKKGCKDLPSPEQIEVKKKTRCKNCLTTSESFDYKSPPGMEPSTKWPLNINDKLFVVKSTNIILKYDEVYDEWIKVSDIMQLVHGDEKYPRKITIQGACAVYHDIEEEDVEACASKRIKLI